MNTEFIIRLEGQFHFELSYKLPFASDHFANKINDLIQSDFQCKEFRSVLVTDRALFSKEIFLKKSSALFDCFRKQCK